MARGAIPISGRGAKPLVVRDADPTVVRGADPTVVREAEPIVGRGATLAIGSGSASDPPPTAPADFFFLMTNGGVSRMGQRVCGERVVCACVARGVCPCDASEVCGRAGGGVEVNDGARERLFSEEAGRAGRIDEGRAGEEVDSTGDGAVLLSKDAGLLRNELGLLSEVTARGGLGASAKRIGLSGVEPMFVRERAGKNEVA